MRSARDLSNITSTLKTPRSSASRQKCRIGNSANTSGFFETLIGRLSVIYTPDDRLREIISSIAVIASEAKQSISPRRKCGLLRRFAPRNDEEVQRSLTPRDSDAADQARRSIALR